MKAIPHKIRQKLASDPFMSRCCIGNALCEGGIEWHHPWTYGPRFDGKKWIAGGQINEIWAIVPVCAYHHSKAESPETKKMILRSSLMRATEYDLQKYPKKDWDQIMRYVGIAK